jgi:hypothetical protein
MILFGSLDPGEEYLYHYTRSETLAIILSGSCSLRLSPYGNSRDPREYMPWYPGFSAEADVDSSPANFDLLAVCADLDRHWRQRAKMACLTLDHSAPEVRFESPSRGWGRARMWEQYADRHRGAVLMFDRGRLDGAMSSALAGKGNYYFGDVDYTDEPQFAITGSSSLLTVGKILDRGAASVAEQYIEQEGQSLYFRKNRDWASEAEYRYVIVNDSHYEHVPVRSSLVAIIIGMEYPEHEKKVLRHRLEAAGSPDLPVASAAWQNGSPTLLPSGV